MYLLDFVFRTTSVMTHRVESDVTHPQAACSWSWQLREKRPLPVFSKARLLLSSPVAGALSLLPLWLHIGVAHKTHNYKRTVL